jgi:hypothetical protein
MRRLWLMDRKQLEVTDGLTLLALLYSWLGTSSSSLSSPLWCSNYAAQTMQLKLPSLSLTHTPSRQCLTPLYHHSCNQTASVCAAASLVNMLKLWKVDQSVAPPGGQWPECGPTRWPVTRAGGWGDWQGTGDNEDMWPWQRRNLSGDSQVFCQWILVCVVDVFSGPIRLCLDLTVHAALGFWS